ncbi:MAG: response regulator [Proteobacteria bacterium]|nr:response regulator [Pseudomonadota bacterium]
MNDTVLIVDDSLTVRMDLADAFAAAGFRVVPCATAAEAHDALQRTPIGLAILDVLLPDGDGIDLMRHIRATPASANVAVLMLSAEAEVKDRIRGLQTGADEYVGKPYDRGYLVARAQELLRDRRQDERADRATVLLIDDSLTFREELRRALETAGYAVLAAETGEEGLRLAASARPSAIVVDGTLPGIDGATVIRRIRMDAALRRTPCLLLTASEEKGAELRALDAGADTFVRKGEETDIILARLDTMLRTAVRGNGMADTASLSGPKRILAVDDSVTYLQEIAEALRGEGYDVVLAHSGEEAIEMLAVQQVDCILLDLLMPGMSGRETCRRIKASPVLRDIPLVMLTALEEREAMIDGLTIGADDFIAKSSELEVLKARVRAQIRRKQFEDENRRIREQLLQTELEAAEARSARELAEVRAALVEEIQEKNRELEAFSYSVAHDLRAPLRGIDGFSQALLEDYADKLDPEGRQHLIYLRESAQHMAQLIDDLLALSRVTRSAFENEPVDLTEMARDVLARLQRDHPDRRVRLNVADGLVAQGDARLLRIALENLLGNAWKFTAKRAAAQIDMGIAADGGAPRYFIRDNGAGFDMTYAAKLFGVFQRLHAAHEFEGTGIGLATVQRIVHRHGGRVWAEGAVDQGATFHFTLGALPAAESSRQ